MTVQEMLDKLFDYQCQLDALELKRQEERNKILTPELQAQLGAIDAEFAGKSDGATQNIAELTEQVKKAVLAEGKSVKGENLHAVFNKGRVSWDTQKLDGLSVAYPVLRELRKEGEPSVSIRKV